MMLPRLISKKDASKLLRVKINQFKKDIEPHLMKIIIHQKVFFDREALQKVVHHFQRHKKKRNKRKK